MGFRQASPGEGEGARRVHFRYVGCARGTEWFGYIAGEPVSLLCHCSQRTKPCLHWLTHGALPCPRCTGKDKPAFLAHVPIYRESDGAPVFTMVHEQCADLLTGLVHPMRVRVSREETRGDSVCVAKALTQKPYHSTLPARRSPADLTPTLLKVWALNELTEWATANGIVSDNALSLTPKVSVADVPTEPTPTALPLSRLLEHATRRAENDRKTAEAAEDQVKRLKEHAAGNGKPKR